MSCPSPLPDDLLVRWWLSDLAADENEALEEHVFACATCTARLEAWGRLVRGMRQFAAAAPPPVLSRAELEILKRRLRVCEVWSRGADRVEAPVPDWAEICVFHLPVDIEGVDAADLVLSKPESGPFLVLPGIPIEHGSGEVMVACSRHVAVAQAELRFEIRASGTDRTLTACTIVNRP